MPKSSPVVKTNSERQIPLDLTAEAMTLSAMMLKSEAACNVFEIIGRQVSCFTDDRHCILYTCLLELFDENKPLNDATVLWHKVKSKGAENFVTLEFLGQIVSTAPSAAQAEYHAAILMELDQRRRLITALERGLKECWENNLDAKTLCDHVEGRVFEVVHSQERSEGEVSLATALDAMMTAGEQPRGIATGFYELDGMLDGLHMGEFSVLAARPSVGKTAMGLGIASHISVNLKIPVAVFSLEMRQQPIMQRLICAQSGVDLQSLRKNMTTPQQRERFGVAVADLAVAPFYLDDCSSMTVLELRARARRMKKKYGIKLFVIDYLQLLDSGERHENRQQEMTKISRGVKSLAGELDAHVLCLAQLNRASESENRRPRTSDLRESGSIEQDADVVMLLHREDVMHRSDANWAQEHPEDIGKTELIVAKQRNGPCGIINILAEDRFVRFVNARL